MGFDAVTIVALFCYWGMSEADIVVVLAAQFGTPAPALSIETSVPAGTLVVDTPPPPWAARAG